MPPGQEAARREAERRAARGAAALLVTLALPGGVRRFVGERSRRLRDQGVTSIVLHPDESDPGAYVLRFGLPSQPTLTYRVPDELGALVDFFSTIELKHVEFHHFLNFDPSIIGAVLSLGPPYDVYIHDYLWICPRVMLMQQDRYCEEPPVAACERCVATYGADHKERISVAKLRERSGAWLRSARSVTAPSQDAARRLKRYFPGVAITVEPWETFPVPDADVTAPPAPPIRVALIGALGEHKGYRVLLECARDAAERRLPLEFVVIGYTENDAALLETGRVSITGEYAEEDVDGVIRQARPHLFFFGSVVPESWCFTLTHALRSGLPVIGFDLGAIGERLRSAGRGHLVPLTTGPKELNDHFLQRGAEMNRVGPPVTSDPPANGSPEPKGMNAASAPDGDPRPETAAASAQNTTDGLTATVRRLALPEGTYAFWVRAAAEAAPAGPDDMILPALYVAGTPGLGAGQLEFLSHAHGTDNWLYAQGDLLVLKVAKGTAAVLVTSLRRSGAQPLEIQIDRLESQYAAAGVADRDAAPAAGAPPSIPARIDAHIGGVGTVAFSSEGWAGRIDQASAIEGFAIHPLNALGPGDIEYKAITQTGFETPWVGDGGFCGTQGLAIPLIGFAVRGRPGTPAERYDLVYRGRFRSGAVAGPCANGAACLSWVIGDVLDGIELHIRERRPGTVASRHSGAPARVIDPPSSEPLFSPRREAAAIGARAGGPSRSPE